MNKARKHLIPVSVFFMLTAYVIFKLVASNASMVETKIDTDILMTGHFETDKGMRPAILKINTSDFSIKNLDLEALGISDVSGVHEARAFMVGGKYKIALVTYDKGKIIILDSTDSALNNLKVEYEETFDDERVRAVYVEDVNGDKHPDVVIGTRPSGILKYYQYINGAWIGTEIDKIGSTIHDLIITDSDGNNNNEIIATTSTTYEFRNRGLSERIPEIIKYELHEGRWNKVVIWQPNTPTRNGKQHLFIHPRYLFMNPTNSHDSPEIISGVVGDSALQGWLTLKWDGSKYAESYQAIGNNIKLSTDTITYGDTNNDGGGEIIVPTISGDALLMYQRIDGKWKGAVLVDDFQRIGTGEEQIVAVAILDSESGGNKKILFASAVNGFSPAGVPKFYTLQYNIQDQFWKKLLVASPDLHKAYIWGMYSMSHWKIFK